jgi:hypothetical protein
MFTTKKIEEKYNRSYSKNRSSGGEIYGKGKRVGHRMLRDMELGRTRWALLLRCGRRKREFKITKKRKRNQNQYSYPGYSRSESICIRSPRPTRLVYMLYKIGGL